MSPPHVGPEQREILQFIHRGFNNVRKLRARTSYGERRLQRRVTELLERGWIEQTGLYTEKGVFLRIFSLTEEGSRNVPSGVRGSTVRG